MSDITEAAIAQANKECEEQENKIEQLVCDLPALKHLRDGLVDAGLSPLALIAEGLLKEVGANISDVVVPGSEADSALRSLFASWDAEA